MMRKVCLVLTARASYARVKALIEALMVEMTIDLSIILHSSACLPKYGALDELNGWVKHRRLMSVVEGGTPATMVKTTSIAALEMASAFEHDKPDMVITVADRFETLATAMAASYMNIPLAHIQGGEQTGSIDDKVRDAISMLADLHFPATGKAAARLCTMGLTDVFMCGCPSIDLVSRLPREKAPMGQYTGVGPEINWSEPYLVLLQHPVTTEWSAAHSQMEDTLCAIAETNMQTVCIWPNVDAGTDGTSKAIREFHETNPQYPLHCYRNLAPEHFIQLLKRSACLVGNSSVGIRECSYLGIPVVNIGTRQEGRERADNVIDVGHDYMAVYRAIVEQIGVGARYPKSELYGDGQAARRIARQIAVWLEQHAATKEKAHA